MNLNKLLIIARISFTKNVEWSLILKIFALKSAALFSTYLTCFWFLTKYGFSFLHTPLTHSQCDQMARLFFHYLLAIYNQANWPNSKCFSPKMGQFLPNTQWALKNCQRHFKKLPNWRIFAISGHNSLKSCLDQSEGWKLRLHGRDVRRW